jgi:hypothetical protein
MVGKGRQGLVNLLWRDFFFWQGSRRMSREIRAIESVLILLEH